MTKPNPDYNQMMPPPIMPQQPITFNNVPLTADAYVINVDLTDEQKDQLGRAWNRMNEHLPKKKMLIVMPEACVVEEMASYKLRKMMEVCAGVLKERGE